MPCDECRIGFRLVLGKRTLWDEQDGEQHEEFQSALVQVSESRPFRPSEPPPATSDLPSLSDKDMAYLFGYGGTQRE